jgi:hypothetical protein
MMKKRLLIILILVGLIVAVVALFGQQILLTGLQAAAPLHTGDYHWERVVARPGSFTLNVRGQGERQISYAPSCSGRPTTDPEFSFYVRRGKTNRMLVLFSGGGACWSGQNCIPGDGSSGLKLDGRVTYVDEIFPQVWGALQYTERGRYGMLDHTDVANPIRDWNAVWIFSCDGSVFWGSNDQEYTDPFYDGGTHVIHHRGFDNTMAVLDYLLEQFPNQQQILVSGQSAGGYGSALLFPYFREAYPDAEAALLVDSAAGIVPSQKHSSNYDFLGVAVPLWQAHRSAPDWIGYPTDLEGFAALDLDDILLAMARYYPESRIAEYTPAWDLGQVYFWHVMNEYNNQNVDWNASIYREKRFDAIPNEHYCEWNQQLINRRTKLVEQAREENLAYTIFLAPGAHHGLGMDFAGSSNGIPFRTWLTQLVNSESVPASVFCTDCQSPETISCP